MRGVLKEFKPFGAEGAFGPSVRELLSKGFALSFS